MAAWEFLLQKKGDKSWLPLESPTVEILSGEYRLASRSAFLGQVVHIQWQYISAAPEVDNIEHSLTHTVSDEGLLLVLPFTQFTPGRWQIRCSISPDFVSSIEFVVPTPPLPSLDLDIDLDPVTFWEDEGKAEAMAEPLPPEEKTVLPTAATPVLTLKTNHFLLDQGTQVTLEGNAPTPGEVQVVIKHPQNLAVLYDRQFSLDRAGQFALSLSLPESSDSLVLLGEVLWQGSALHTITFTYPMERLQQSTPIVPPRTKLELPIVKKAIQPMPAPDRGSLTNGKVAIVPPTESNPQLPSDLWTELEDIFEPVEGLLAEPTKAATPTAATAKAPPPPKPAPQPRSVSSNQDFVPPPLPQLSLLVSEIQAGLPILLRATLPAHSGDLAVKLWMKDCQTRTLIDGPRWLLDWRKTADYWQSDTYICFPLGQQMVTIEAISVDLTNRGESRKVHLDCPVVPPGMATRSG